MTLGGLGLYDHRRVLSRLLSSPPNETVSLSNTMNYSTTDFFRYKTSMIFVCIPSIGFERLFRTYIPVFDILLVAAIPFLLLCFTNIGIIIFTMKNSHRMREHRKRSHRRHQRLTIMLLSVTLAFIGLTCPSVVFICANKIIYSGHIVSDRKDNSPDRTSLGQPPYVQLLVDVCEALWYTKHAMNFILYTLSGQDFRREFLKLFTRCFNHRSFVMRKFLSKTPSTTSNDESTLDTQIRVIHSQSRLLHRKTTSKSSSSTMKSSSIYDG